MPRAPQVVRAAIYCRISLARYGETIKVEDQEKLCQRVAEQRGWQVGKGLVFVDNSRSAWKRNRKRPGWDALLEAIKSGSIDAIIVYHGDRLIRQPWDLEMLLRLADERGIRLASPTGERNLDSADDRYILRIEAAHACRESDNTSRRMKRSYERRAEAGVAFTQGARPFGFDVDHVTHRPDEVEIIKEMADRILAGESLNGLCRDLNRRGISTARGNRWEYISLRLMLARPRNIGLLEHRGEIVGTGNWEPVLDRETWEALLAVFEQKLEEYPHPTPTRRYLLTGIALCAECEQPMRSRMRSRGQGRPEAIGRYYSCLNRECGYRVSRAMHHLDAFVEGAVLKLLNDPRLKERQGKAVDPNWSRDLAKLQRRRKRIVAEFSDDETVTPADLRQMLQRIDEKVDVLRRRIAGSRSSSVLDGALGMTPEQWVKLPLDRRRAIVTACVKVVVKKSRPGRGFDPTSVQLVDVTAGGEAGE